MLEKSYDINSRIKDHIRPNPWDFIALVIILSIVFSFAFAGYQMAQPYNLGETIPISLDINNLPNYALRTIIRMVLALALSLFFTFTIGTFAAKNRRAETIIIPMIDVLQAIPVLSFLSITVVGFIALFPGSLLGPECASIFAIFTAQAWNMMFGFYQSLKTIPGDLKEVARMYHLSSWQKFWRIEVPFAMPSLLWNMMMSMSASWFFVVASEAISVANQNIQLPGIGSYIALAIEKTDFSAISYAILAMLIVIILYDQLFFRPFLYWSERFNEEVSDTEKSPTKSWFITLIQKTRLLAHWSYYFAIITNRLINLRIFQLKIISKNTFKIPISTNWIYPTILTTFLIASTYLLSLFIINNLAISEVFYVAKLGFYTALRVFILIVASSILWVPIGVYIGKRPNLAHTLQPIIQFLASFPANLLFPFVVISIVRYQLNVEIWTTPLMILGSQWYILFNVIAGTLSIPKELHYATDNLGLKGISWWTKFILPGIFPFYITGAITAAGGAWNASIVAELVYWGDTTLQATGLGTYIAQYTTQGDFHRIALGTSMMCVYVLVLNKICWQPLYKIAEARMQPLS